MQPGAVLANRFEIERTASSGGMGTVYRARDRRGGGLVALKLLRTALHEDELRFEREARLLAQLEHPGIVRHVDHGRAPDGAAWLAMEWLDGEDLGQRLARGPLSVDETRTVGRRAAEALAAAHASGVVHRDVKPSNIFLPGQEIEQLKVIDFGIARGAHEARTTLPGAVVGTPAYMAPERARGASEHDPRADLFSLGCVLFECLAGRPPFIGQHVMAVLMKIVFEDAPALWALRPDVPPALADLIARMLAKRPEDRPAGAEEVAAALGASGPPRRAPAPPPALTGREQRLVSVVVARASANPAAETVSLAGAKENVEALRLALAPFGARLEHLIDGSLVAAIGGGDGGATDQAARAARCALVMRAALPVEPLALATGRGLLEADVPIGEAIDRAVALLRAEQREGRGRPGRIVVDPVTAGLLDARFVVEPGARHELRGERDALLDGVRSLLGQPTPCVGREREVASLAAVFSECAAESVARAVLLTGPPGIGKSRVVHELLQRLRQRGDAATIWFARGDSMGTGSSWGMVAQMITRAAGLSAGEPLAGRQDKLRALAGRGLSGEDALRVAELLGELVGAPFSDEARPSLRAARRDPRLLGDQLRLALEDLLTAECSRGPVLLVFEDLHWADAPSVAFVDAALRHLADRPLMVLAPARPDVAERFPRLWAARGASEIPLGELPRRAGERLARLALGDGAPPATVERVVAQAAGNPFYLEELIRDAAEGRGDAPPGTVLAMVQARLESLSPEARRVLRAGSVFGGSFWNGALSALLGAGGASMNDAFLAELEEREVIVRRRQSQFPGEEEHAFRHALVRETAYGMLTDADRTTGHRLAGAWLEQAGERDAMRIAEHFELGAEPARAAGWYGRAAEQAMETNDLEAVIARARRAADLSAEGEVLGAALLVRGGAHLWRSEFAEAGPSLMEAMRLLPPASPRWFRAAMDAAWAASGTDDSQHLLALALELEASLGTSPIAPALVAAANMATLLLTAGFQSEARSFVALAAGAVADPGCDPVVAAHAHELASFQAITSGDLIEAVKSCARYEACFEQVGDARNALRARGNAANLLLLLGQHARAEADLHTVVSTAERLGLHYVIGSAQVALGYALLLRGALDEASRVEEQAIALLATRGDLRQEGVARMFRAMILLCLGDLHEAEAEAARAAHLQTCRPAMHCFTLAVLAQVLLARNRTAEPLAAVMEAMGILDRLGGIEEGEALIRITLAEALHAAGDLPRAREAVASARDHLLAQAARITDPAWREDFLANIPENARTLVLAAAWLPGPGA